METTKFIGKSKELSAWIDAGDCLPSEDPRTLKYCLVGSWKTKPNPLPYVKELEDWVKVAWRLKEHVMIAPLNEDLLFFKFDSSEEAWWVLENGRRWFKGDPLHLEWWNPEASCVK